jgi:hypothetical protein
MGLKTHIPEPLSQSGARCTPIQAICLGEMIVFIRGNLVPAPETEDELVVVKLMEEVEAQGIELPDD